MTDLIIGGETFNVQVEGDAKLPALLLSNSLGTNLALWDGQVPELSKHFRVIRYDSRGHGGSTSDGAPYSVARLGRDALAILDALNVETTSFVGISMGGAVGLWLLINAPERIERAVLANTAARLGSPASWNARILSVLKSGMADNADATIERWFSPNFARKAPERVAAIHECLRTASPDGYAASCAALRDMDLREALPRISRPVLVISGKDDPVIPDADTDALVGAIANARHVPLNARHISNVEAEEAFTKAVLRFLLAKRLRSTSPAPANRRVAAKRSTARGPLQAKAAAKKVRKTASKAAMPSRRPVAGKKLAKARTNARQALHRATTGAKAPPTKAATGKPAPAKSGAVKKGTAKKAAGKTTKRASLRRATTSARSAVKKVPSKKPAKTVVKKIAAKKNAGRRERRRADRQADANEHRPPMRSSRLGATLALLLTACLPAKAEPFRIGLGAPLSGSDAIFGNQLRLGVQTAVADLNAKGGFAGRNAEVVARDDGNDVKKGVDVAKTFVAQKLPVVIGHFSSAVTVPASAVYAEAGVVDITPSAMAPLVTDRGLATVFRTCGREDAQAAAASRYLLGRHVAKVAILHDRTSTGKALADAVRKALAAAGVRDVYYGSVDKGSREFAGLVSRIKSSGAQIAFWGGGPGEAGALVRQLRDANAKTILMGGIGMASEDFASLAGPAADGTLIVFPEDPKTRPAAAQLLAELRENGIEPDGFTFYAYAAVQVVQQAADAAKSLEPSKLAAAMHSGLTFKTVIGDFAFDQQGDPMLSDLAVYVWHKGATGRMTFDDQAKS